MHAAAEPAALAEASEEAGDVIEDEEEDEEEDEDEEDEEEDEEEAATPWQGLRSIPVRAARAWLAAAMAQVQSECSTALLL